MIFWNFKWIFKLKQEDAKSDLKTRAIHHSWGIFHSLNNSSWIFRICKHNWRDRLGGSSVSPFSNSSLLSPLSTNFYPVWLRSLEISSFEARCENLIERMLQRNLIWCSPSLALQIRKFTFNHNWLWPTIIIVDWSIKIRFNKGCLSNTWKSLSLAGERKHLSKRALG